MRPYIVTCALAGAASVVAQHNASGANGCNDGFFPGTDTVIYTVPYTYAQVMSIIGDYKNLTWSGSPCDTVTLNGTDNTVGTARTYDIDGAHVVETITTYSKPPNGPYEEIHVLGLLTIPQANVSFYSDYDGTTVTPICSGAASTFNFTINFCATNATLAGHLTDAQTVGVFLGGQNFSSCGTITNSTATSTSTSTSTSTPSTVMTSAANCGIISVSTLVFVAGLWWALAL